MKKSNIFKVILMALLPFFICSCSLIKDDLDEATIYTTVYPINFLVNYMYGDYAKSIESIYPSDCDLNTYEIPEKKLKEYANAELFIYNGLTNEKNIAKSLVNTNKNLIIIDASYRLNLENNTTELWLSPNNFLMLAKNIKDKLTENLKNKSTIDGVNSKFNNFEERISTMDASLHAIGKEASLKGKNTIIASNSSLKFLNNYGFNVIALDDEDYFTPAKLLMLKNSFLSGRYKNLLVADTDKSNELVNELSSKYKASIIDVNTMTLSLENDYFDIMATFIENVKNAAC